MVYVIQVCWQLASSCCSRTLPVPSWSCSQAVTVTCTTYTIAVCTVKNSWRWAKELSETYLCSKNKFEKIVHLLVGFIIGTAECQGLSAPNHVAWFRWTNVADNSGVILHILKVILNTTLCNLVISTRDLLLLHFACLITPHRTYPLDAQRFMLVLLPYP